MRETARQDFSDQLWFWCTPTVLPIWTEGLLTLEKKEGVEEKFSGSARWENKLFFALYLSTTPSHTHAHASFASEWWLAETFVFMKTRLPAS